MTSATMALPPISCGNCGNTTWFRIEKGRHKSERIYACQRCGYKVKSIIHSITNLLR